MLNGKNNSWWLDSLVLTFVLGSLFFIALGVRPLFTPDEGRYAEIAREMVTSGDYVTPYLNGIKYFEKPILFYWLGSAAIKIGGLNLWSIRSINAILGLMGCLLTYFTGRQLYDRRTGLLSALILGTSMLYFVMSHMISLDLPVTIFLTATLYAFILGCHQPSNTKRRLYLWGAATVAALAVLTKGLIGIVFPLMIIGAWIALLGEWRMIKRLYIPSCILVFLLLTSPWHILVGHRNPEFFYFYFIEQHFLRYTSMEVGHYQPAWFFIPCLLLGFFPWIVFLPQAICKLMPRSWKYRSDHQSTIFFMLWALLIFAFFSFSKSKLIPYILPVFPPLAILTGRYLSVSLQNQFNTGIRVGYFCLVILSAIIACTFYTFTQDTRLPDPALANIFLSAAALILITGSIVSGIFSFINTKKAIALTITTSWLFLVFLITAVPAIDSRTIRPLAMRLKPIIQPQDDVITYNQYYQDLPFYLERRVSILNWRNEMSYGMQHQDTYEWMINDQIFWQRWHSKRRIFVVISMESFMDMKKKYPTVKYFIVGETANTLLLSNRIK